MEFSEVQTDLVRNWNERLPKPLSIRFLQTDDARTGQFQTFGEMLSRLASKVQVVAEEGEGAPALIPGKAWRYHLVPAGAELEPFLELTAMLAQDPGELPAFDTAPLRDVRWPSRIKIYVTNYCPHCRSVVTSMTPLPLFNPLLHITVIDGALFPELAAEDKVRTVPTVVCDDRFRWTGPVSRAELITVLAERDPSRFGMETFKRMIQEGDAGRLAGLMLETGRVFPGFLETLMHSDFQTRLGAMVVFENIAERMPELAQKALEPIWERIGALDETVKGDMIYLFGKAGDGKWISRLEAFDSTKSSDDFRGIVAEALENLRQRK